jgi:hypothetical protein
MIACQGIDRTHLGDYNIEDKPCGRAATQFTASTSNTTGGLLLHAYCEDHKIPDKPPPGIVWNDEPSWRMTEDEYQVALVMES